MYIEGRKKKRFSEKLVAEVALYLLITHAQAIISEIFNAEFNVSERTVYRYARDLELCGLAPRIRYESGEYTVGYYELLDRESPPLVDDPHILRLDRLIDICQAFYDEIYCLMLPEEEQAEEMADRELTDLRITPKMVAENVSTRTIQRDLDVIFEAAKRCRSFDLS